MVATTLTVVSCLHRHASLDSMREVETVQPLAPLPIFGKTIHGTRFSTAGQRPFIPGSDHEIDMLDDARADLGVAAEFDAGRVVGAAAGQPGEQQAIEADVEVGSDPPKSSTTCARPSTATRMVRASGPVSSMATRDPSGALPSLPTTYPIVAGDLVQRQPRAPGRSAPPRMTASPRRRGCPARASSSRRAAPA